MYQNKNFQPEKNTPINHIGIYELDLFIDDNQLDREGIIVAFEDKQYLIQSKEEEKNCFRKLRFQIGARPILTTADDDGLFTIGITNWDINGNWSEFENNNLLNDD